MLIADISKFRSIDVHAVFSDGETRERASKVRRGREREKMWRGGRREREGGRNGEEL